MPLKLVTADERLADRNLKVTMAIFGIWGIGKTSLLHTLDQSSCLFLNLEAGDKSVQSHLAHEFKIRSFTDAREIACLIGGPDPAAADNDFYSEAYYRYCCDQYPDVDVSQYKTIFCDSITDLTRLAMTWAKQQPEAFSEKTGKPDIRGAYGLLGREVIKLLKHLQHAPGKNVIFVGVLEEVKDDFGRVTWEPQMEGGKVGRELPGIVDQVVTMGYFDFDPNAEVPQQWRHEPGKGAHRVLVCKSPNQWGLPAKDRSGNLDLVEKPHLGELIEKINKPAKAAAERLVFSRPEAVSTAA